MCGQALPGQDIGGFESAGSDQWADPALLIRWTIAGAFLPWFRNHYNRNSKCFQEPFNFVEWFNTDEARNKGFYQLPSPQDLYLKVVPICRWVVSSQTRAAVTRGLLLPIGNSIVGRPGCSVGHHG